MEAQGREARDENGKATAMGKEGGLLTDPFGLHKMWANVTVGML